jgi:hypothetical protein
VAISLVLDVRDEFTSALRPVGAPPLRVALETGLCDRVDGFVAEVAHEVAANDGELALALIRPALAPLHLPEDLSDIRFVHALDVVWPAAGLLDTVLS